MHSFLQVVAARREDAITAESDEKLWNATTAGDQTALRLLLVGNAALVNTYVDDDTGHTLLMEAVCNGHLECAKLLLQAGANPELSNITHPDIVDGCTAFSYASLIDGCSGAVYPTISYEIRCGTHRCSVSSTDGYECIHTAHHPT